ncbi:MAG: glycosyltransferase family 9 protein [Brevundimonas sp.]|nr:MAG: glycosyltransferase family 9 protein [Brevundimonas sp.]
MAEVLIIANSMIGDVILTTGAIEAITRRHPEARFTVVCSPATRGLFGALTGVAEVFPLIKRKRGGHWFDLFRRLGGRRWEAVYDFRGTVFSRFLKGPKASPVRATGAPPEHKVVEAASILGAGSPPLSPVIWMTGSEAADVPARVESAGSALLILGPGASRIGKTWPAARFAEAARFLTSRGGEMEGALVVVTGGPMDREAALEIGAALPKGAVLDMTGADLIRTSAVMGRARLFVGNDSGMMHLAAASGAPTLGLFGPTDERLYGPWGSRTAAVRPAGVSFDFGKTSKTVSKDHCQMEDLSVAEVVVAAQALLRCDPAAAA